MFDRFFVQNNTTLNLLNGIGIQNAEISGDTRFDRVRQICNNPKTIEIAMKFSLDSNVLVLGSTWPSDMENLRSYINKNPLHLKYIIAPHNIHKNEIQGLEKDLSLNCIRISQAKDKDLSACDVLIIDNIGMLSSLYQYGKVAYIGGAFNGALHNILEAATYGLPVIFGKHENNAKFQEAVDLVKNGGAFMIQSSDDFEKKSDTLFSDPKYYGLASHECSSYVIDNSGATDKIMHYINTIIRD
jgi:3-deoxy-D-manno-octulosonic-acid transferase